jgi:hypothetical protein
MKYIYTGVFFDAAELSEKFAKYVGEETLSNIIKNPHVTFTFKPSSVDTSLLGKPVCFTVTGYACDRKNQGLSVEVSPIHAGLSSEYQTVKHPHITISVSEDGRPVDTGKLCFTPLPESFDITGKYGVFTDKGVLFDDPNPITVLEFCLHKTQAMELCVLCDEGWIVGAVWIDHEDIFRIPDSLKDQKVTRHYWKELTIVNADGEKMKIPAHFIDT